MKIFCSTFALVILGLVLVPVWADDAGKNKPAMAKEALGTAKIDLLKAVEVAQQKVPDGKLLAVRLERKGGKPRFGFYFQAGNAIKEVEIDTQTGDMLESKEAKETKQVSGEALTDAKKASQGAKVSFSEAVQIGTEKVKGGKPFEAEMRMKDGKPIVEVELLTGDKIMKVQINAADAKEVKVEEWKNK